MTWQDRDRPASIDDRLRRVQSSEEFAQNLTILECHAILALTSIGARLIVIVILAIVCAVMPYFISTLILATGIVRWASVATLSALAGAVVVTSIVYCAFQAITIARDWARMIDLGYACHFVRSLVWQLTSKRIVKNALVEVCQQRIQEHTEHR
ncbi:MULTISPECIES: hypothetical protein [Burkholderia]|uniref:hypothetical protein n=1 Tax=Burkholderia TaxID=32008 RepID=UPI00158C26DB|nr:hypothetical protein [Burkholderia seminalis]